MRILVTFAVDAEFAPWLSLRKFSKGVLAPDHWSGGFNVCETECGNNTVCIFLTGIGAGIRKGLFPLALCAKRAGIELFISSGLAGSLKGDLRVGDVFVPRRIGTLREASGIPVNTDLLELARGAGAKIVDALLTSDHIVETGEEKGRLASWGDAVDMESNGIMSEFLQESIPSVTIRAISDASDEDLPIDFSSCLTSEGKVKPLPLLKRLMRKPSRTVDLVRFGVRSKKAARNLVSFLDSFVVGLSPELIKTPLGVATE